MKRTLPLIALLLATGGCSFVHQPVPVYGESTSLASLDGQWEGTYSSYGTGRTGAIFFDLTAAADSSAGEVVMFPARRYDTGDPSANEGQVRFETTHSEVLAISFVRAEGNRVTGRLSPYTDPDCGCTLSTTFDGELAGDRIEGTFTSHSREHGHTNLGIWQVTRKQQEQ